MMEPSDSGCDGGATQTPAHGNTPLTLLLRCIVGDFEKTLFPIGDWFRISASVLLKRDWSRRSLRSESHLFIP